MQSVIITDSQLIQHLIAFGVPENTIMIYDEYYNCPTKEWIVGPFAKQFNDYLFYNKIQWIENKFDCNKFSKLATCIADMDWLNTPSDENALAYGLIAADGHCITIADHNGEIGLYEPQPAIPAGKDSTYALVTMTPVIWTKDQLKTCVGCLFC